MKAVLLVSLTILALGSCKNVPDGALRAKCGCPPSEERACGKLSDGAMKNFESMCKAGCAGATDIQPGPCDKKSKGQKKSDSQESNDSDMDDNRKQQMRQLMLQMRQQMQQRKDENQKSMKAQNKPGQEANKEMREIVQEMKMIRQEQRKHKDDQEKQKELEEDLQKLDERMKAMMMVRAFSHGCECKPVIEPVCAKRRNGRTGSFRNKCMAECLGATDITEGKCVMSGPNMAGNDATVEQPADANAQQPADANAQQPADANAQPADANAQQPDDVNAQQPADANAQQPDDVNAQQPADANAQPADANAQQPADANAQQPADVNDQQSADANVEHPALCGCQPVVEPVCAKMSDGSMSDFMNGCEASCADAMVVQEGKCEAEGEHEGE